MKESLMFSAGISGKSHFDFRDDLLLGSIDVSCVHHVYDIRCRALDLGDSRP